MLGASRFGMRMRLKPELRDRCKGFGSSAIQLYVRLPRSREEVRVLGHQVLRSATSVGAHAREASRARSDAEFCAKIDVLAQEADESQLWLEYLEEECHVATHDLRREADELIAIFTAISTATKQRGGADGKPKADI